MKNSLTDKCIVVYLCQLDDISILDKIKGGFLMAKTIELTDRQADILQYVRDFTKRNGFQPSLRDIADKYGFTPASARTHLKAIEHKGFIKCNNGRARAIEIL
jgi:DNA-binding MarR family transcriptional regulator